MFVRSYIILVQTVPSVCPAERESLSLSNARKSLHEPIHLEVMMSYLIPDVMITGLPLWLYVNKQADANV